MLKRVFLFVRFKHRYHLAELLRREIAEEIAKGTFIRQFGPRNFSIRKCLKTLTNHTLKVETKDIFMGDPPVHEPPVLPVAAIVRPPNVPLRGWEQTLNQAPNNLLMIAG